MTPFRARTSNECGLGDATAQTTRSPRHGRPQAMNHDTSRIEKVYEFQDIVIPEGVSPFVGAEAVAYLWCLMELAKCGADDAWREMFSEEGDFHRAGLERAGWRLRRGRDLVWRLQPLEAQREGERVFLLVVRRPPRRPWRPSANCLIRNR